MNITENKIKCVGVKKIMEECCIEFVLAMNLTLNKFEVFSINQIMLKDYTDFENIPSITKITDTGNGYSYNIDLKDIIRSLKFYKKPYRFIILIEQCNILYSDTNNSIETLDFEFYNFDYSCKMTFSDAGKLYEYVSRYYKKICTDIKNIDLKLDILKEDKNE